jgi:LAO/AO transport system kinase
MAEHTRASNAISKIRASLAKPTSVEQIATGILAGDRLLLAQSITLIESQEIQQQKESAALLRLILPHAGGSVRIGISGVPGAGKSSFIEAFGNYLIEQGKKVAVLAVDPSSDLGKGSIMGDKTRMVNLSTSKDAFIRPSPTSGNLGGVARKTRESIFLCEAAGFDVVLIETVGVGQSETAVHSMTDFFILIVLTGAGDELQGIKRGIMELADLVLINKADGENLPKAKVARLEASKALHFFPALNSGWTPQALACSSIEKTGISEVWSLVKEFEARTKTSGWFEINRKKQLKWWLRESISNELQNLFFNNAELHVALTKIEQRIDNMELSVSEATHELIELLKTKL